jgi:long-chain acyl-CoA synthetase
VKRSGKALAEKAARRGVRTQKANAGDEIKVPGPLVAVGRKTLTAGMEQLYARFLSTQVRGTAFVPPFGGFIVAANHSSHLDTGLVKYALGESGPLLVALAAKDYFFDDPVRRMYFENFTNIVPMERHGSLRDSLRLASEVIRSGYVLLIYPEGTRSMNGVMSDFKPSLGYLALSNRCGILPMFLEGTYDAMPKGRFLPKYREAVGAHISPYLPYEALSAMTQGMSRAAAYRHVSEHVEGLVRGAAPKSAEWALGGVGRVAQAEFARHRQHAPDTEPA